MSSLPRLRMFAGPNGSGKSTIKSLVGPKILGVYINPDDIEKSLKDQSHLDLSTFGVRTSEEELRRFFRASTLLNRYHLQDSADALRLNHGKLCFTGMLPNSYHASVVADFIRRKLLDERISFAFETVMSFPDKIGLLEEAQKRGFRTYLYYVATEAPDINISRVRNRVEKGGHDVPEDKIVSRYYRSLELLSEAIHHTNRAYIFDNSSTQNTWLAEITDGKELEIRNSILPPWFEAYVLGKMHASET